MSASARTWWGWHRLDDEWACLLVDRAGISPGDLVVDLGAGAGAITAPLVRAGARVLAVELHPRRAAGLRRRFGSAVRVVEHDATALVLPRAPFRVVANPPFSITTTLLRTLCDPAGSLVRADLVVPRHVAARWSAGRGADASRWSAVFSVTTTLAVPRRAFDPPPPGQVAVLTIERRGRVSATPRGAARRGAPGGSSRPRPTAARHDRRRRR